MDLAVAGIINLLTTSIAGVVVYVVTRRIERSKRTLWILEYVSGDEWTLQYSGSRTAWAVRYSVRINSVRNSLVPEIAGINTDWGQGDRTSLRLPTGEELEVRWIERDARCSARIQTRQGQFRYEVGAGEVIRSGPDRLLRSHT